MPLLIRILIALVAGLITFYVLVALALGLAHTLIVLIALLVGLAVFVSGPTLRTRYM